MDIKKFNLWNKVTALAVLLISAFTYLSTIEPTASLPSSTIGDRISSMSSRVNPADNCNRRSASPAG